MIYTTGQLKKIATGGTVQSGAEYYREGILLEKGAVLSQHKIEQHEELYKKYINFFVLYPDLFLDLITPTTSKFELKFFQRMFLRACVRYGRVGTIASRAAGKSFICILALVLIAIFRSGSHVNKEGAVVS